MFIKNNKISSSLLPTRFFHIKNEDVLQARSRRQIWQNDDIFLSSPPMLLDWQSCSFQPSAVIYQYPFFSIAVTDDYVLFQYVIVRDFVLTSSIYLFSVVFSLFIFVLYEFIFVFFLLTTG